jgi:selenoprotein W-related protein
MNAFKRKLTSLELVPGEGGRFELFRDGKLVFSKLATKRFPDEGEVVRLLSNSKPTIS